MYKSVTTTLLTNFEFGRIRLIFLVMVLFYNITESSFTKSTNFLWFIFLLFGLLDSEIFTYKEVANIKDSNNETLPLMT
jgi:hypothetical protein